MTDDLSRRAFLNRASALSMAGAAAPFALSMGAIGEAAAATATDYKALVCIFLFGGNDYANTVVPYDAANYTLYQNLRSNIAYQRSQLDSTVLNPVAAPAAGRQYALAPELAPLIAPFDAGKLAVMLNLGTLVQPTTKAQYSAGSVRLPPKLFSHNDQQSYFQASNTEGASSGWGGRIGDLFQAGNGNATLTCINASGNAVFLTGRSAVQYSVSTAGPVALNSNGTTLFGSTAANSALRSMITAPRTHLFENEHTRVTKRSLDAYTQVTAALAGAPTINTVYPTGNTLADQLKLIARLIATSNEVGAKRQVYFASLGGFDTHDTLVATHSTLLTRVGAAMRAFYDTTVELGIADRVTAFTASDFGRTLVSNTDGSDHGWGSMHFVIGGAVNGRRFYGAAPAVANNGPDDVGQGRLLPSIAVDQYAATLASWFGVSATDLPTVLPNITNYSTRNLGFI